MNKPKILLTCPWMPRALAALKENYVIALPARIPADRHDILGAAEGVAAFCPVFTDKVDTRLIQDLPASVQIIASLGVGVDHIDLNAAQKKGLAVSNTPDVLTEDTADLTMGLILSVCRGFSEGERLARSGEWKGASISSQLGRKVSGKTLGIVGLGRIGKALARRAKGFDMKILYTARTAKPEAEEDLGVSFAPLEDLLAHSDIVALLCDLNQETRHIINAKSLKYMKKDAFLINSGRGALVDEAALSAALELGHLGGAGLDVYEFEPKITEGLKALTNVTLLPHLGSATFETRTAMGLRVKENLDQFFLTGKPKDPVI